MENTSEKDIDMSHVSMSRGSTSIGVSQQIKQTTRGLPARETRIDIMTRLSEWVHNSKVPHHFEVTWLQ
jgi:hypothetical protein